MSTSPALKSAPLSPISPNQSPSKAKTPAKGEREMLDSKPLPFSLSQRDTGLHSDLSENKSENEKKSNKQQQTYISPSDMVLSPATRKISALKGRKFATAASGSSTPTSIFNIATRDKPKTPGQGQGQSLFAKLAAKNAEGKRSKGNSPEKGVSVEEAESGEEGLEGDIAVLLDVKEERVEALGEVDG